MKKIFAAIPIIVFAICCAGCNGSETSKSSDTSGTPAVEDSMPVLRPSNSDSMSLRRTPPTNDSNVIMPDSAIKSK